MPDLLGTLMVQTLVSDELDFHKSHWMAVDFNAFQPLPVWTEFEQVD